MRRKAGAIAAILALLGAAGALTVLSSGALSVAATNPDRPWFHHFLHYAMRHSVAAHARGIAVPPLDAPARIANGAALYRANCAQCHGGPGTPPGAQAYGMRPQPTNLVAAGREWPARELYWVVRHGIKMTPMPGWEYRLGEGELWDVVAFLRHMPQLSPADYARLAAGAPARPGAVRARPGDARAGRAAIHRFLCATCHTIPGVAGSDNNVGPPLAGIATRGYIGGVLRNTPDNMVAWLRNPQAVDPRSAMPALGLSEQDARDIAAYMYTLE